MPFLLFLFYFPIEFQAYSSLLECWEWAPPVTSSTVSPEIILGPLTQGHSGILHHKIAYLWKPLPWTDFLPSHVFLSTRELHTPHKNPQLHLHWEVWGRYLCHILLTTLLLDVFIVQVFISLWLHLFPHWFTCVFVSFCYSPIIYEKAQLSS